MTLEGTPWVDRALNSVWDRIVAAAPKPEWVPLHTTKGKKLVMEELGCGHYGCVMPTSDPQVVVKVTSDMTEAAFVAAAMVLGPPGYQPDDWTDAGIVQYHGIYRLPGLHRGRPMFVLWREAATKVGLELTYGRDYEARTRMVLSNLLSHYKQFANIVREAHKKGKSLPSDVSRFRDKILEVETMPESDSYFKAVMKGFYPTSQVGVALAALPILEEVMQNTVLCDAIGNAFAYYREEGLLLADVHNGNVGKVDRLSQAYVITDPGHAVPLNPKYETVAIEDLP